MGYGLLLEPRLRRQAPGREVIAPPSGDTLGRDSLVGETLAVGGTVSSTTDGMFSTRRGNASAWTTLIGKSPVGTWELTPPDTEELRNRFQREEIADIVLVVTYKAQTPVARISEGRTHHCWAAAPAQ